MTISVKEFIEQETEKAMEKTLLRIEPFVEETIKKGIEVYVLQAMGFKKGSWGFEFEKDGAGILSQMIRSKCAAYLSTVWEERIQKILVKLGDENNATAAAVFEKAYKESFERAVTYDLRQKASELARNDAANVIQETSKNHLEKGVRLAQVRESVLAGQTIGGT